MPAGDLNSATLTGDGNTDTLHWLGGRPGTVAVWGDFGGGTAKLQMSFDGGDTWIDEGSTFSADGASNFQLPGCLMRVNLSGATSPDLNVLIRQRGGRS